MTKFPLKQCTWGPLHLTSKSEGGTTASTRGESGPVLSSFGELSDRTSVTGSWKL